ncbi:MAG TPA: Ser-Thr-rich GPI-anchored membrane family protein, partial [Candidatus Paceibacterota bacterium]|nr:Ser-Thr-rich GPI-anchored membrane family protein [Candidatus Paceibacterota bacterium]
LQKGFIVPLLIVIIAILVIGFGVYVYNNKKAETPAVVDTETQPTNDQTAPDNKQENASITILSPNGGEKLQIGKAYEIKWTAPAFSSQIQLFLMDDRTGSRQAEPLLIGSASAATGKYLWTIPSTIIPNSATDKGSFKIEIEEKSLRGYSDMSDNYFSIISSTATSNWKTYTNTQYGFLVQYPSDFVLTSDLTATQQKSVSSYMGACPWNNTYANVEPNEIGLCYVGGQTSDGFTAAALNVIPNTSTSMQDCQKTQQNNNSQLTKQTIIGGINFYEDALGDAGLGHYLSIDSFRSYHAGTCYNIELNIESQVGNSPSWNGLDSDFVSMMSGKLKSILSTFKFTK